MKTPCFGFLGRKTLIAGDVLFNDMHLYTAETDMRARERWLNSLTTIRELKPAVVIPGHSKVGAPIDATSAVTFTEKYLLIFEQELKKAKEPDDLIKAMKEKFPSSDLLLAIEGVRRPMLSTSTILVMLPCFN